MSSTRVATADRANAGRYAYQAFISYSHAADGKLAESLQSALQRFAKPWHQRRALRVFRDTTGLTVTPDLWDAIREALAASEYFILLASERAAQSRWVELEIETWLEIATPERLLIVWTDGELVWDHAAGDFDWQRTTCLSQRLRGVFDGEPLHLDLRWARTAEDLSARRPEFLDAVARLSATLRDVPFDDLVGEEIRQHRRTKRLAASAITGLVILLISAAAAAWLAVGQRNAARRRLIDMTVASGAREIERGDLSASALWFAQALDYETDRNELDVHQLRLQSALQLHPALLHVMTVDTSVVGRWAVFSRDASHVVSDGFIQTGEPPPPNADGTIGGITVWNAQSGEAVRIRVDAGLHLLAVDATSSNLRAVATDAEGTARLFDARTGATLATLAHDGVFGAEFSHDGRMLLTTSSSEARVWSADDARALHSLPHDSELLGASFTRDARRVVSSTADNRAHVWTLTDDGSAAHATIQHNESVGAMDVSSDGRFAITVAGRDARLWELSASGEHTHLESWIGVEHAEFSPDGAMLLLADVFREATVMLLDPLRQLTVVRHELALRHAAFSPDGESIATAGADNIARVWNARTGEPRTPPLHHEALVTHVAFDSAQARLVTATADGLLRIWDLRTAPPPIRLEYVRRADFNPRTAQLLIAGHHSIGLYDLQRDSLRVFEPGSQVYHAEFSPDGARVVVASEDGTARVLDAATGREQLRFEHERRVEHAGFHPARPWLITAGAAGSRAEVVVWDLDTRAKVFSLPVDDHRADRAWFNADGTRILTHGSGTALWDAARRERIATDSLDDVRKIAFSADGTTFVAQQGLGSVRVYDAQRGLPIGPRITHENFQLEHVSFGADARTVLVTGAGYARLWDASSGAALTPPLRNAPGSIVHSAVMSPNGQLIATFATEDGTIRLWNARNGQPVSGNLLHANVTSVAFKSDGSSLVTVGSNVRVWPLSGLPTSPDRLALTALVLAARRIDDTGAIMQLDAATFREQWNRLTALSKR